MYFPYFLFRQKSYCDSSTQANSNPLSTSLSALGVVPESSSSSSPAVLPTTIVIPPLQFDQYAKEWQALTAQDNFDGFRVEASKSVTPTLQASHSLILGTSLRDVGYFYQFGPTFQSVDGRTIVSGRIGLDGAVSGRVGFKVGSNLELKVNASSSLKEAQRNMVEVETGYFGKNWASAVKVVHQGTWIYNATFSREITSRLCLGGEITFISFNGASISSFGGRYVTGPNILTATVSQQPDFKSRNPADLTNSVKLQYVRKISERLSLGTEFEASIPDKESAMKLGYEYTFRHARVQGMIDTSGKASCFVSDFMGFGVSGMIDYLRGDYKFGFMMHIVPQPEGSQSSGMGGASQM